MESPKRLYIMRKFINKLKNTIFTRSRKKRWVTSYLSIAAIGFLTLYVLYFVSTSSLAKQIHQTIDMYTDYIRLVCDTEIQKQKNAAYILFENEYAKELAQGDNIDSNERVLRKNAIKAINDIFLNLDSLDNCMLVFKNRDLVISREGASTKREAYKSTFKEFFSDEENWEEDILNISNQGVYITGNETTDNRKILHIQRPIGQLPKSPDMVFVSILLEEKLLPSNKTYNGSKSIINVFSNSGKQIFGDKLLLPEDFDISEYGDKSIIIDGSEYLVSIVKSNDTNLMYIQFLMLKEYRSYFLLIRIIGIGLGVICLLVCIILAIAYSRINYKPIKNILSNLSEMKNPGDEFEFIENEIINIVNDKVVMKKELDIKNKKLRDVFWSIIFNNSDVSVEEVCDEYKMFFHYDKFVVICFEIKECGVFENYKNDFNTINFMISNVFSELIGEDTDLSYCVYSGRYYCIVNSQEKNITKTIISKAEELIDVFDNNFNITIYAYMSQCGSFKDLHNLYLQTTALLPYSKYIQETQILNYNNLSSYKNKMPDMGMNKKIQSIIEFVKNNYQNMDLNVTYVANEFNLTVNHLSRIFKTHEGMGIGDFILRYRCEKAVELMQQKKYTISEVSNMCGFCSSGSFIRAFKRLYGVTPGKYVESLQ